MKFTYFTFILLLFSCSTEKNKDSENSLEKDFKEINTESKLLIEKRCFENKTEECSEEEGKYVTCRVNLEIKGTEVIGNSNCVGCGGNGDGILVGTKKGDTLFLDDIFMESDGTESKMGTIWLLKTDKLLQFQTVEINGVAKIEDPNNAMIIFAFDKISCE